MGLEDKEQCPLVEKNYDWKEQKIFRKYLTWVQWTSGSQGWDENTVDFDEKEDDCDKESF